MSELVELHLFQDLFSILSLHPYPVIPRSARRVRAL